MSVLMVTLVGNSESGKTTLITKLIPALKSRGYRIGSAKHAREIDLATEGDARRHLESGSETTVLATPEEVILFKPGKEPDIEDIKRLFDPGLDLVICEGFKRTNLPKIEVYRKGCGARLEGLTNVIAVVSDEPLHAKTPQFAPGDIEGIADLLEKELIQADRGWLDLYIDGKPVPLTAYPEQVVNDVLIAAVRTLKGVGDFSTLEVRLKQEGKR